MRSPLARSRFARDHRWSQAHMSEYVDAELTARDRERIERHARDCSECRELLASLQQMILALATLPAPPAESVAVSVLAGVRQRLARGDDERG
jgi:anti-sigma factor RsiW